MFMKRFDSASSFTLTLPYAPSSSHYGTLLIFNSSNTSSFVGILNLATLSLSIIYNPGNTSLTVTASNNELTITNSDGTLWGGIGVIGYQM